MKDLIVSHSHTIYLKPGEVLVSRKPVLVSTVLGSCVAVTLYSPSCGFGAICHAMLPESSGRNKDLRYVDTALKHIYEKIAKYGNVLDLEVKLFGGAQLLGGVASGFEKASIGDQNIAKAVEVLSSLGFTLAAQDTGGMRGRKLFFCTRSGDVFVRYMRSKKLSTDEDIAL
ncbi:MAG: chemotaxis protein CheD [Desulfuromonadaceae bacterium]|nr:chemotaxis protein CheD [Desulfuromonadaceae bacterium]MDD5105282.1 chemotaxis protein CheD [Desulfuromonadaceae bacterium]